MKIKNFFQNPYCIDAYSSKIPHKIRQFFRESIISYNNEIPNAASIMCKKTIIEICIDKKIKGKKLTEKINNLKIDKKIINFLCSIPNMDSQTINSKPLSKMNVKKIIKSTALIIESIYI